MTKKKSRVIVKVADGAGGMLELKDRRFGPDDWPIKFKISIEHERADRWGRYVAEGARERGWSTGGLGQIDRTENSGTITIIGDGKAKIEVMWERRRNRPMKCERAQLLTLVSRYPRCANSSMSSTRAAIQAQQSNSTPVPRCIYQ